MIFAQTSPDSPASLPYQRVDGHTKLLWEVLRFSTLEIGVFPEGNMQILSQKMSSKEVSMQGWEKKNQEDWHPFKLKKNAQFDLGTET